jgi:hypothetical protein
MSLAFARTSKRTVSATRRLGPPRGRLRSGVISEHWPSPVTRFKRDGDSDEGTWVRGTSIHLPTPMKPVRPHARVFWFFWYGVPSLGVLFLIPWAEVGVAALAVLLALVARRAYHIGVWWTDDVLFVQNFWRRYEVPWAEVEDIRYCGIFPSPIMFVPAAWLLSIRRKGRRLPVFPQATMGGVLRVCRPLEAAASARGIRVPG